MNTQLDVEQSGTQLLATPAGQMEVLVDSAQSAQKGLAVVLHPQPLMGGSARHKVPDYLAKGLVANGWATLRPNFRGVGQSTGVHDEGRGESQDVLGLVHTLRQQHPGDRIALVGFSFGAYVAACVSEALSDAGQPAWRICLAGMPFGAVAGGRHYDTPMNLADALVVHGEQDERVPLASVMDWARPATQPVVVVPGADHFFTGRLPTLRALVQRHLQST